jgi:hypothetical protein
MPGRISNAGVLEHPTELHRNGKVTTARRLGFDLPIPPRRHPNRAKQTVSRVYGIS